MIGAMARGDELTYREQGATRDDALPAGYRHVQRRTHLGDGEATFVRAAEALFGWQMHRGAGLAIIKVPSLPSVGAAVVTRLGPPVLGMIVPCRIVYVVDEARRRGFAYGTLPGHPESGEEAFVVEWAADDGVYLVIRAFSRPGTLLTRLGGPVANLVQDIMTDRYVRALRRLAR
jgi:uncharacterized protein (UPF0548 family)